VTAGFVLGCEGERKRRADGWDLCVCVKLASAMQVISWSFQANSRGVLPIGKLVPCSETAQACVVPGPAAGLNRENPGLFRGIRSSPVGIGFAFSISRQENPKRNEEKCHGYRNSIADVLVCCGHYVAQYRDDST
jgi:hypothetical protein